MNQENQLVTLPIEILFRIFDLYLDFEDSVTVFHVSLVWRASLALQLWRFGRMQRFRNQGQLANELNNCELEALRSTYLPNAPLVLTLLNPSTELINALDHFGSRHQSYIIRNYK